MRESGKVGKGEKGGKEGERVEGGKQGKKEWRKRKEKSGERRKFNPWRTGTCTKGDPWDRICELAYEKDLDYREN